MKLGGSIKFLGAGDIAKIPEPRLALYRARAGETWRSIAEGRVAPKASGIDLAAYNGQDAEKEPEAGFLLKIPPASAFE
jgi:hypothetical protein